MSDNETINSNENIIKKTEKKKNEENWNITTDAKTMLSVAHVYMITNTINNKKYVGISSDIKRRWSEHKNLQKDPYAIHLAIQKYGLNNFKFEILEECHNISVIELSDKEKYYIKIYNTFIDSGFGYNMTTGGQLGMIRSELTSQKFRGNKNWAYNTQIYEFINLNSGEQFSGTSFEFRKKYNLCQNNVSHLTLKKINTLNGWYIKSNIPDIDRYVYRNGKLYLNDNLHNRRNVLMDKTIFRFENDDIGICFFGTKLDFSKNFDIDRSRVNDLVKRKKYKNWKLIS